MHEFWMMYKKCARGLDDLDLEQSIDKIATTISWPQLRIFGYKGWTMATGVQGMRRQWVQMRQALGVGFLSNCLQTTPQESPFQQVDPLSPPASTEDTNPNDDDILDPDLPIPSAGKFPPEIHRREYRVLGPNSLWHHDGQHGLIQWGIIIHGFINGYSCLITGLCASNNNTADTSRGVQGFHPGSVEIMAQKIYTSLPGWNPVVGPVEALIYGEEVSTMSALNASPARRRNLIEEELEVYRIDWQGLRDDGVLQLQAQNNPRSKGSSSWVGHTGPPPDLSEVIVQSPQGTLTADKISHLYDSCSPLLGSAEDADIISLWNHTLTHIRVLYPNYHFPEEEDDTDNEDYEYHTVVSKAEHLLKLYNAEHVIAEVGVNKCWRLQCNRCSKWVNTSIPGRTPSPLLGNSQVSIRTKREASVPIARNITYALQRRQPDAQQHLPHDVWTAMEITETEQRALGSPHSQIPARFARVTGLDEGVDTASQQLGVQRRATVRTAPTTTTGRKKRKGNSGAVIPIASGSGSK
ncbi:hypothetical protein B0H14DRAFT_3170649 [Mycena olivaceomarginata]|nr:hypothetical protein B0H14DRAFT_3170649 [Mycena olivaceomarginata]